MGEGHDPPAPPALLPGPPLPSPPAALAEGLPPSLPVPPGAPPAPPAASQACPGSQRGGSQLVLWNRSPQATAAQPSSAPAANHRPGPTPPGDLTAAAHASRRTRDQTSTARQRPRIQDRPS